MLVRNTCYKLYFVCLQIDRYVTCLAIIIQPTVEMTRHKLFSQYFKILTIIFNLLTMYKMLHDIFIVQC